MPEKGFRELICHSCGVKLRIKVNKERYGRTGDVTCTCSAVNRITIPVPVIEPELTAPVSENRPSQKKRPPETDLFGFSFPDNFIGSLFGKLPKKGEG